MWIAAAINRLAMTVEIDCRVDKSPRNDVFFLIQKSPLFFAEGKKFKGASTFYVFIKAEDPLTKNCVFGGMTLFLERRIVGALLKVQLTKR